MTKIMSRSILNDSEFEGFQGHSTDLDSNSAGDTPTLIRNAGLPNLFDADDLDSSSEDDDFQPTESSNDTISLTEEQDAGSEDMQEELCRLEGDQFLTQADGDLTLAGMVGAVVHFRETQRETFSTFGNMWQTLFRQNQKLITISQSVLEVHKRPTNTNLNDSPPSKISKKSLGKAKVPKDCSVSTLHAVHTCILWLIWELL